MLNRDFKEFVELLNSIGVEYLIVGGYALAAHGHPRYTGENIAQVVLGALDERKGPGPLGPHRQQIE